MFKRSAICRWNGGVDLTGMKIYAYGIINSNAKIDNLINGLEGACVYNFPFRDIGVVVSEFSGQTRNITKDYVLEHEEAVERLMEDFTVLPVKFLTVFNEEEDVFLMMKEYYSDFSKNLDKLRNKIEFGIKVIWHGNAIRDQIIDAYKKDNANLVTSDNSSVKIFVKEKFEKYKIDKEFRKEADRCVALVDGFFSRFAVEKKLEKLRSDNLLLNASYLVEKERQKNFKEAFELTRNTMTDFKYLFSGPWPPYNFIVLTKKPDMFNIKSVNQNLSGENII